MIFFLAVSLLRYLFMLTLIFSVEQITWSILTLDIQFWPILMKTNVECQHKIIPYKLSFIPAQKKAKLLQWRHLTFVYLMYLYSWRYAKVLWDKWDIRRVRPWEFCIVKFSCIFNGRSPMVSRYNCPFSYFLSLFSVREMKIKWRFILILFSSLELYLHFSIFCIAYLI